MVHRIRVVYGYHGNELGRYQYFEDQYLNPTVWALLNTEFILVNTDSIALPGARRVVGPVSDAAGTRVTLFQLPGRTPVRVGHTGHDQVSRRVRGCGSIPRQQLPVHSVAIFDTASKVTAANVTTIPGPLPLTTHVDAYAPGHIALTLSGPAPAGSALVVSENYYPGWHATVDGKPAEAQRADLTLIGIPLPAGAKKVELNFSSDTYKEGKTITLAAIALAIAAVLAGLFAPGPKERAA